MLQGLHSAGPHLFVLWVEERGDSITAVELKKIMNFPLSTARRVMNRLKQFELKPFHNPDLANLEPSTEIFGDALETEMSIENEDKKENISFELPSSKTEESFANQATVEDRILALMKDQPITFDAIFERCELTVSQVLSSLMMLELAQKVERLAGDRYVRKGWSRPADSADENERQKKRSAKAVTARSQSNDTITLTIRIACGGAQSVQITPLPNSANPYGST